jgi:hypothetical protein
VLTKWLQCLGISSGDVVPVRNKKELIIPFVEKTGSRREFLFMIEKPKLGRDRGSSVNVCIHVRFSANPCDPACLVFSHKFKPQLPAKNFCRALQDFERHAARLEPFEEPHGHARIGVARVNVGDQGRAT